MPYRRYELLNGPITPSLEKNEIEDLLISIEEIVNEIILDQFNNGFISNAELKTQYRVISEWSKNSQWILRLISEQRLNGGAYGTE